MKTAAALFVCLLLAGSAFAKEAAPLAQDPATEKRMIDITSELRCLVCQNESLAASQAELANDLREEVRKLIKQGKTDDEVKDYLVVRYGDFVLYRPPVKSTTWLLWGGPFLLLAVGIAALIAYLRRRSGRVAVTAELSEEDKKRAEALLKEPQ
ncbi:MAG: cytochrome c-type biogenesis protein CcmH [Zoogloeaceae bacterium]|jgi:cytochrome c-type biogenesis protein CcmH|nr:cytochrome c-type biogenesis protein CcmH [Zoogloeaceae bacterium]